MADFTANMSDTVALDKSLVLAFEQQFLIASAEQGVMDQFVTYKQDIGAKSISLTKYSNLALATSALSEKEDVASEAMVDAEIVLTPVEYGNVVTTTKLASLQSGGKIDVAAARLVGINMGRSLDRLAVIAAEASSNALTADGGAESALAADKVMTEAFLNKIYNKLARTNVAKLPSGEYVAIMHDDVIHDLRASAAAGSWLDLTKYAAPGEALKNEVGMCRGFRIVRDNHITISADAGAAAVDTYKTICLGYNGLGKAVSEAPHMVLSGPFDKLKRFLNIGWTGCLEYKIVDQDAVWVGISTSSVGANA